MRSRRRKPTATELRAMGATPGLMARRIGPDGRARLEQLTAEGPERRRDFVRRLARSTEDTTERERSA